MSDKFQNKYRIPSARATFHDYNGGAYFVTVCAKHREHFFGKIVQIQIEPQMILTETGNFANENLQDISNHYPYAEIPLWVIMPNHIHAIVFIDGEKCTNDNRRDVARNVSDKNTVQLDVARNVSTGTVRNEKMIEIAKHQSLLCVVMRGFKSAVTKFAHENGIEFAWQTRFHDRVIRNQEEMNIIANYIENNIAQWDTDCFNKPGTP
jgi:REP element-mobilizing transposase RayT